MIVHFSIAQYSTILHCTILHSTLHYITLQPFIIMYCKTQYSTLHNITLQLCTILYCTIQYSTLHYTTLKFCTILYCTIQYSTLPYSTVQWWLCCCSVSVNCPCRTVCVCQPRHCSYLYDKSCPWFNTSIPGWFIALNQASHRDEIMGAAAHCVCAERIQLNSVYVILS